ncbi:uncharacterized protein LOC125659417 isoform X2 [Ostrea edulis]|uniref:uncharacterized protein LOC125659417 isoform X2 n=1 Tax=Ostrea edulis TaxID=37623 RepID=UPI0024AFA3A8|nr:uncharacterized protein LOC125659417 isoform X2 [Ostrea edulis]XP_056004786.1 uncharacterized protein LOC125659417 isoform X2 [Ostrea edulis]XP_056004790.1 uncharacterized protein LOC125659417 isoform X2 [Ostrea edulis]
MNCTLMRKCMQTIWMAVFYMITLTWMPVIDCKVEYAEYGSQKKLKCGCIDDEIQTRLWYMDGALLIVDEHPEDNWAPDLLYENETLRLQIYGRKKYYIGNVTYECIAILRNGSKLFCGSYTIKAYDCKIDSEWTKPKNMTDLVEGASVKFTCEYFFHCDKVNDTDKSVSIISSARNTNSCDVSENGLKHECRLKILSITDEDFSKPVQCIVTDGGHVSVYEAFLIKRDKEMVTQISETYIIILVLIMLFVVFLVIGWCLICICRSKKLKRKYKCLSVLDNCHSGKDHKNNHQVLVYSVNEEDDLLTTKLSFLQCVLKNYELATYNESIVPGKNKTEAFSELASRCVALIIVVVVDKLSEDEDYRNKFNNILKSKVAKGQCCVRPYYTSIFYVHSECCKFKNGSSSCVKKTNEEKNFVYFDICDSQWDVKKITEKLRKRLPPRNKPNATCKGNVNALEQSNGSYDSFSSLSSDNYQQTNYSRMESVTSCSSSTPQCEDQRKFRLIC